MAKKFGEQYSNAYNNAKVAFNLVVAEKAYMTHQSRMRMEQQYKRLTML